jgi:cytochrome b561
MTRGNPSDIPSTNSRYNSVAILLHWVIAAAIVGMLLMGVVMDDLEDPAWKAILYPLHKSDWHYHFAA